ncbi:Helix-turn-helix domain-containing protein [Pseudarcicella hirudinis]|uniref:Helix-turn-helix domain-containing protein n=1 Tax=Pseudarcicella hirudinis TaxID=1079859 RepID=A0A1I5VYM3_9BACT|nr:helix-turn-helix transcriptional regulator [Pseudarcicella hirudinis]SFQ12638.1 Helix-turn-helix domain-containing protein [Pseudarcicella hirudinis]
MKNELAIGEKIRLIRIFKGFSQESISFCLGISQQAYHKIEKGQTALTNERLESIAEILEVKVVEIESVNSLAFPMDREKTKECRVDAIEEKLIKLEELVDSITKRLEIAS